MSTPNQDIFSLNDIPEEISNELIISDAEIKNRQVLELLRLSENPLNLDQLLVGCFRRFGVKHRKSLLASRIHRLIKKTLVIRESRGRYSLNEHT